MDRVCGLDVHKDSVFMCILTANGEKIEDVFARLFHLGFRSSSKNVVIL